MDLTENAQLVSLALTLPTVALAAAVVRTYYARMRVAVRHILGKEQVVSETDFLVTGIVIAFVGAILDNSFWFVAWTAAFVDLPIKDDLFAYGVWANIPFRQTMGIVAALFHLWPVIGAPNISNGKGRVLAYSTIALALILVFARFAWNL